VILRSATFLFLCVGMLAQSATPSGQRPTTPSEQPARLVRSLDSGSARVLQVGGSPDGSLVAVARDQMQALVWDASTGKPVARVQRASAGKYQWQTGFSAVALSADNKLVATGGQDGQIDIWALADGKKIKTLSGHIDSVRALAFDPTGKLL